MRRLIYLVAKQRQNYLTFTNDFSKTEGISFAFQVKCKVSMPPQRITRRYHWRFVTLYRFIITCMWAASKSTKIPFDIHSCASPVVDATVDTLIYYVRELDYNSCIEGTNFQNCSDPKLPMKTVRSTKIFLLV